MTETVDSAELVVWRAWVTLPDVDGGTIAPGAEFVARRDDPRCSPSRVAFVRLAVVAGEAPHADIAAELAAAAERPGDSTGEAPAPKPAAKAKRAAKKAPARGGPARL